MTCNINDITTSLGTSSVPQGLQISTDMPESHHYRVALFTDYLRYLSLMLGSQYMILSCRSLPLMSAYVLTCLPSAPQTVG